MSEITLCPKCGGTRMLTSGSCADCGWKPLSPIVSDYIFANGALIEEYARMAGECEQLRLKYNETELKRKEIDVKYHALKNIIFDMFRFIERHGDGLRAHSTILKDFAQRVNEITGDTWLG